MGDPLPEHTFNSADSNPCHGPFDVFVPLKTGPFNLVLASATEVANGAPIMGLAPVRVDNVVPQQSGVRVRGFIDWHSDIVVRVTAFRVDEAWS